ncbi:hypothetical protein PR202_ga18976 [Eleusine coracana subsp. coracana]|uniref:Uncharacterized protein n=1 Tax=Eleusine coracana subsp. coracana TaxID=191504 RepID=A0AAV5CUJ8_ELECO|nr:hypothetical protein PR202_ga18976 [Eleusine coracana subsp. coracana]
MGKNSTSTARHGTETSSRCVTNSSTATHNFEVTSFSMLDGMGTGEFVLSSTFSVAGRDWNISVYPDGWKEEDKEYVSVFLCLINGVTDARAKYSLSLFDKDGKVSKQKELSHTFQKVDDYWGFDKFVKKSKLKEADVPQPRGLLYNQLPSFAMADASASSTKPSSILSETSSSCYTQAITAAHNFEVINFSLLEGMGTGKIVSSRNFNVGGYDWKIDLYPDGCTTEKEGYVSAFLVIQGEKAAARAKFSFSLLGKDGQVKRQNTSYIFKTGDAYGWKEFMQKSDLQPLLRLNNDSFTIRCVLTVITDPLVEDVIAIVVPQPNLLQDFAQMLKDGEGADVTFSVGDQLFPAHRCVLAARSAVLKAELFSPMKEKATKHIRIDDIEPSIFEALLHFIYTDSLPDDCDADKNVPMQHLLVAADRYGLDRLRLMCEVKMCNSIDAETVATTLALAEQHHCAQLKKACLRFVTSRGMLGAVMESNGFDHLAASCPLVLLEILDRLASLGI